MGPRVLVGRERELAELDAAFGEAAAGRGALVLVRGEPGIGKTHIADVFAERAAARGARVAWGRAWEVGGAPAYWPWIEAFRASLATLDADERRALPGARLAELAQIDPELREQLVDVPAPTPLEPQQARFRLFDAASALIRHLGSAAPIVIVIDDLHAADSASIELLQFVARNLRTSRCVLIATFRDNEARVRTELAEVLARIGREGRTLALRRLDENDVTSWVTGAGKAAFGPVVFARSEGNPLFIVELLRLVDELGDRALAEIPEGVRDVIRQRLRGLSDEARAVLSVAAVIGRSADVRTIARVLGRSVDALSDDLALATSVRVVTRDAHRITFSHVLIQEVLHAELPVLRRAELHGVVADAIDAHSDERATNSAEIAHHLFEAIAVRGNVPAIDAARRAASHAAAQLAFDDAIELLARAFSALNPGDDDVLRGDLLLELSRALFAAGRATEGRTRALDALAVIRRTNDVERIAHAVLLVGSAPRFAAVDDEFVALLEEALAVLPAADSALRARLLARLGAALQPAPDPEPPMHLARQGLAMSRRTADPATHLEVLHSATAALGYFADPTERIPLNQELASVASRLGDKPRVLRAHLRLVFDYLEAGDGIQADACIEVCARLAAQLARPAYTWAIPLVRAMRRVLQGQFAAAEALAEEARAIAAQVEDANHELSFTFHRVGLLRTAARTDELAALLPTAIPVLRRAADRNFGDACIAGSYARIGARAEARAQIDDLLPRLHEMRGRQAAGWLAEAAAVLDDAALAERLLPILTPFASRTMAQGVMMMWCEEPLARHLALAATTVGKLDDAATYFESALVRTDALGALPHRARIQLEYAALLERRALSNDRDRAAQLRDAAHETATRLGMTGLVTAPRTSDAPLHVPTRPAFELRPEGDYWTIACGETVFRLKDSRGLRILALLVASPEREFHVVDLAAPTGEAGLVDDAGEALDARAIAAYKQRITDLRDQLAEAEGWSDPGRASRLREELDAIGSELARGLGLGGRARRVSSSVERARVSVRKRVSDAIGKIGEHSTPLAQHLEWAVKTGTFCAYHPTGRSRAK